MKIVYTDFVGWSLEALVVVNRLRGNVYKAKFHSNLNFPPQT